MMSTMRRFALAAVMACAGFVIATIAAYAQPDCHCDIVDGCKVITFYAPDGTVIGHDVICPSTGTGDFNCNFIETPPPGTPLNLSFPPINIDAHGFSPTYGPIHTYLDPTRQSSNATVVSNNSDGQTFPATVRFSFYARSVINGIEYCSRTELVFSSNTVHSFRPFNQERFCLENDVEFYRCDDPAQTTAFVLNVGASCVTLN